MIKFLIQLYFANLIDKKEALKRLKFEKTNQQICIRNQNIIDNYLHFMGSKEYGS